MGEFSFENSKLKASRHFSGTFKPSLIIIDIRHADNEFEARFFGRRYKSVGQTEGRAFRVIFFAVVEHVEFGRRNLFQSAEITVAGILYAFIKPSGIL